MDLALGAGMQTRLPGLRPLLLAATFLLAASAALSAQATISIGATILPTVGDDGAPAVQLGMGARGLEVRTTAAAAAERPILRSTHVTETAAEVAGAARARVLGAPQRTDVTRDAAAVRQAVSRTTVGGVVRLVHTTMMVVDA